MCNLDNLDESRDKLMLFIKKHKTNYRFEDYGLNLRCDYLETLENDVRDRLSKNFNIEKSRIHFTILNSTVDDI